MCSIEPYLNMYVCNAADSVIKSIDRDWQLTLNQTKTLRLFPRCRIACSHSNAHKILHFWVLTMYYLLLGSTFFNMNHSPLRQSGKVFNSQTKCPVMMRQFGLSIRQFVIMKLLTHSLARHFFTFCPEWQEYTLNKNNRSASAIIFESNCCWNCWL